MKKSKILLLALAIIIEVAGIILIVKSISTDFSPAIGIVILVIGLTFLIIGISRKTDDK